MNTPAPLTPSAVQTLRDSLRWRASPGVDPVVGKADPVHMSTLPYVIYMDAEQGWALRQDGRVWAHSPDPEPLLACLMCERLEPGYIRRIMDAREPCDVATLAPDDRLARQEQARRDAARIRELERQADERRRDRIRRGLVDVSKLSLNDLL